MGLQALNPVPALIEDVALGVVRHLALGGVHSCALRDDERVLCWGYNRHGQLGSGANLETSAPNPQPTLVQGLSPLLP